MPTRRRIFFSLVVLLILSLSVTPIQAAGQEKITVDYYFWNSSRWELSDYPITLEFSPNEEPRLVSGRVLVPLRRLAEYFNYQVDYFPESKAVKLADELGKTVELTLGQSQTIVNGRQVSMDVPAEAVDGVTFVPLRFIAENFDMAVEWQSSTRSVLLYDYIVSSPGYIFDRRSLSLLERGEQDIGHKLVAEYSQQDSNWCLPWISAATTARGNNVVVVSNNYGEPHIWNDYYYHYIADGQLVAQSHNLHSKNWNWQFSGVSADGSRIILGDGKTATVYDDQTQQIIIQYDLQALCAGLDVSIPIWYQNAEYDIVYYDNNCLLLWGSSNKLHIVVYPDNKQVDVVYKEVLSVEEQQFFEGRYIDGPSGANVAVFQFEGESDGFLAFNCNLLNISGHDVEYRYKLTQ